MSLYYNDNTIAPAIALKTIIRIINIAMYCALSIFLFSKKLRNLPQSFSKYLYLFFCVVVM